MILFFRTQNGAVIAVKTAQDISNENINALNWLFSEAELIMEGNEPAKVVKGEFIGPRREMITPWSTTAVEITQNMNIVGIERIEEFFAASNQTSFDKMLQRKYNELNQELFTINKQPDPVVHITDIEAYNVKEGLALNKEEIEYLKELSTKLGRPLTDSEVFGFSQVNSEHCRHKIFNGIFIIDGKEMESSLFKMIKKTSQENPNLIVSAYKDNCAFVQGPEIKMFHPQSGSKPSFFTTNNAETVISLKAETHNFPTTVEPFNGAATGSGGEIRDRIAGGKGSFPITGTACYMTSYPRFNGEIDKATEGLDDQAKKAMEISRDWEKTAPRPWLYQSPQEILTKASNGASDFGNKFGQSIICGSLLTAEGESEEATSNSHIKYAPKQIFGYDKVIMLAGGIGYAKKRDALKDKPEVGDKVVLLGGDNYRIGMGGGAVSSVDTGVFDNAIELNAIQRSNPEMQKRAYNAIRAVAESNHNTIISVHDHGAGGHLNCLSELVEETGGNIDISKLPVGDPTLSLKEIIGNESQERMGLVMKEADVAELKAIAERERAPMYVVGETTGKHNFTLKNEETGEAAIDFGMEDMFGSAPKTYMEDVTAEYKFAPVNYDYKKLEYYLTQVLQIEGVACKDWLTNKVDRSVSGLIATQQCTGEIQLPLNNVGVIALGFNNNQGVATSMGHAPLVALADSAAGSRIAIGEALTNLVWAPLGGAKGNEEIAPLANVSLSANWMWPCRNQGEDARLYNAVKGASDFACALGLNIPTGKDSMSMTQKYSDGKKVLSPGTLIVSTVSPVTDVNLVVSPNLKPAENSLLIYMPFTSVNSKCGKEAFPLGGSAFAQIINKIGNNTPDINDPKYFADCFNAVQNMVKENVILAGHDISQGGLITAILEMCFPNTQGGLSVNAKVLQMLATISEAEVGTKCFECEGKKSEDLVFRALFSEVPGVLLQVDASKLEEIEKYINIVSAPTVAEVASVRAKGYLIGNYLPVRKVVITGMGSIASADGAITLDINALRDIWYKTSYLFDIRQVGEKCAKERFVNYKNQPLQYKFPNAFSGNLSSYKGAMDPASAEISKDAPIAAIIREKGSNGDREMAWALYAAGFNVRDVHMTDLIQGRETLEDVKMLVFVGGFSNADTLGSAKGWAGAFLYNEKAKKALDNFYARKDTMSLGICNGCQLMAELGLITPENRELSPKMVHNNSHKYESGFVGVTIQESPAIMLKPLEGSKLGIWVAHGEGKFSFPAQNGTPNWEDFKVAVKYSYDGYPANPNGSPLSIAGVCSTDGRHLAMMPHPERCVRPWNWAHYPVAKQEHQVTPWIEMFIAAAQYLTK